MPADEVVSLTAAGLAFLYLGVVSVVLVWIDVASHRLPNRIVLPSYLVALALFGVASTASADPGRLLRAVMGMMILFGCYFVIRLASSRSIGGGDVKLAGLLGLYFGWIGWDALLVGTAAAFIIGGVHAVVLLVARKADRRTRIAFGPAMLAGAWVAIGAFMLPAVLRTVPWAA